MVHFFVLKLQDAISNYTFQFYSLIIMIAFMLFLIYRYFFLRSNQINYQIASRIGTINKKKKQVDIVDSFSVFINRIFSNLALKVDKQLERANVLFNVREYYTFMLIGMSVGAIVGLVVYPLGPVWSAMFKFAGFAAGLFGRIFLGILCTYGGYAFPRFWLFYLTHKRKKAFEAQITDALLNIADALKSGYTIQDGIKSVGEEMPYPMGPEFKRAYLEMGTGSSFQVAMDALKERVNLKDFSMAVDAIEIQYEAGGKLDGLLRDMVAVIQKRLELKKEIEKQIAGSKMTGYVLLAAPIVFLLAFSALNKNEYLQMLHIPLGIIMIIIAILCYIVATIFIIYIIRDVSKEI